MNKFYDRLNEDFISVSCISQRQLFILVRNKSVVPLLWMISIMVTLRLWMSYSYIDDSCLIIYKKYCSAKKYPGLIMTLQFKSWMVWWCLKDTWSLDTYKPCLLGEMTKTSHSGKRNVYWLLSIIHCDVSYVSMWWISLFRELRMWT